MNIDMKTMATVLTDEDALIEILRKSHADVLAGKTYSQEEADRFLGRRGECPWIAHMQPNQIS